MSETRHSYIDFSEMMAYYKSWRLATRILEDWDSFLGEFVRAFCRTGATPAFPRSIKWKVQSGKV